MKDFNKKKVFITGGSAGIGLSTAKLLASRGADVYIFARNKKNLENAVQEISEQKKRNGQAVDYMQVDVADNEKVAGVMKKAIKDFGTPDLLINSAGRAIPHYFEDISFEQFDATMKINTYGVWNVCAAIVPEMKKKGGTIVNVSSIGGYLGLFGYTDYCASKFAVIGFSEALRSELKRYNINVSVLCPADTDTPGFQVENLTKPEETIAVSGNARLYQPDEIAGILVRGIEKERAMIITGFDGKIARVLRGIWPGLLEWVFDRDIRKAQGA